LRNVEYPFPWKHYAELDYYCIDYDKNRVEQDKQDKIDQEKKRQEQLDYCYTYCIMKNKKCIKCSRDREFADFGIYCNNCGEFVESPINNIRIGLIVKYEKKFYFVDKCNDNYYLYQNKRTYKLDERYKTVPSTEFSCSYVQVLKK
jgi:hypothetical protein